MKFLRTAPTRQLLMLVAATVLVIAAGTAIAIAATSGGPVPKPASLATAIRRGLAAPKLAGVSADITFTNNLIGSDDFQGDAADPLLQGASGRLWYSPSSGRLRLELQSDGGDSQIVVNRNSFWISDRSSQTVYEGTLPAEATSARTHSRSAGPDRLPSTSAIDSALGRLARRLTLNGASREPFAAAPTDVAGQPAYSVRISPRAHGGEVGGVALAWDALRGVPLDIAVYAKGNPSPVLALRASKVSFGAVPASVFAIAPPSGDRVVKLGTVGGEHARTARSSGHRAVTGVKAVSAALPFALHAPAAAAGMARESVARIALAGKPAALVTYGQGLGGVAVIESAAEKASSGSAPGAGGGSSSGLSVPTVTVDGASARELETPLGTGLTFQHAGVRYLVLGSVARSVANSAAAAVAGGA